MSRQKLAYFCHNSVANAIAHERQRPSVLVASNSGPIQGDTVVMPMSARAFSEYLTQHQAMLIALT